LHSCKVADKRNGIPSSRESVIYDRIVLWLSRKDFFEIAKKLRENLREKCSSADFTDAKLVSQINALWRAISKYEELVYQCPTNALKTLLPM
jgi:hypothetical protein